MIHHYEAVLGSYLLCHGITSVEQEVLLHCEIFFFRAFVVRFKSITLLGL
jgi:hypothetical protein